MLRITGGRSADGTTNGNALRLEGQVAGPWVEELQRVCHELIGVSGHAVHPLVLDLTNVSFVDADGVALFRELTARRVSLTNCSVFVAEQLKEVTNGDD
jgi:anti-anti-sigma regulatory factor